MRDGPEVLHLIVMPTSRGWIAKFAESPAMPKHRKCELPIY